jgi:hypothetical protein
MLYDKSRKALVLNKHFEVSLNVTVNYVNFNNS